MIEDNEALGKNIKNLEITIEYEQLYFDDILYIFNSLKRMSENFFDKDEFWMDEDIYGYLKEEDIDISKSKYYKLTPHFRKIVKKSLTYQIIEFEKGSLKLKCCFAISEASLVPLVSSVNLPAGLTLGIILGITEQIYDKHEEEFDEKFSKLKSRWKKESHKKGREKRGIYFDIKKED